MRKVARDGNRPGARSTRCAATRKFPAASRWVRSSSARADRSPDPLTVISNVIGSPTLASVGVAVAAISKIPTSPEKPSGRPAAGSGSTVSASGSEEITRRRMSRTVRPSTSRPVRKLAIPSNATVAAGTSRRPDSRGTTVSSKTSATCALSS